LPPKKKKFISLYFEVNKRSGELPSLSFISFKSKDIEIIMLTIMKKIYLKERKTYTTPIAKSRMPQVIEISPE
jgi:ACT domain-containing protein